MGLREQFLQALAEDGDERCRFVETLRAAASFLDGSVVDQVGELDEATKTALTHKQARRLREAAARLCHHGRQSDGICRYCEAVMVEGG